MTPSGHKGPLNASSGPLNVRICIGLRSTGGGIGRISRNIGIRIGISIRITEDIIGVISTIGIRGMTGIGKIGISIVGITDIMSMIGR